MMRTWLVGFLLLVALAFPSRVRAEYVLPYPSYLPGNKLYHLSRFWDATKKWWYFGSISSLKYHLQLADKYLVEAKTLFEYKQYLLGRDALLRSNSQFQILPKFITDAAIEGKDIKIWQNLVEEAGAKHIDVMEKLLRELPP